MNRIDRLFAILLTLQHKRKVRAQDLAKQFEISKRTIYRDMSALNQMGIPIAALPGEGFELVEGYYIPPLMFTESEALMLFLGTRLLTQQAVGSVTQTADSALAKIKVALPEQVKVRAEAFANIIQFITAPEKFNLDDPQLLILQKAIHEKKVIHIHYHSYTKDEVTQRNVEPYRLYYLEGAWLFEGYCQLRQEVRMFRLSRVDKLNLTQKTFSKKYIGKEQLVKVVKVLFENKVVRWVREHQHYGFQAEKFVSNGVEMTYHVHDWNEMTAWLLGWVANAEVLTPIELRQEIRKIATELANLLT